MLDFTAGYHYLNRQIKSNPLARSIRSSKYKKIFSSDCYGCFWGVFDTFEEAMQAAPQCKPIGYDNNELAKDYQEKMPENIQSYDYPILFWLKDILVENSKIFDFGGNVGIHFFLYYKYIQYPTDLEWIVCDVPAIIKAGEELAVRYNQNKLKFTDRFERANDCNVFFASGSIQYLKDLCSELLRLPNKPEHVLINRLPLYNGKQFVTLQNGGNVFYPQYVFNKNEFICSFLDIGYTLIDQWSDRTDRCFVPFPQEKLVREYTGLYFKLKD